MDSQGGAVTDGTSTESGIVPDAVRLKIQPRQPIEKPVSSIRAAEQTAANQKVSRNLETIHFQTIRFQTIRLGKGLRREEGEHSWPTYSSFVHSS
jgi:hypothetical protein